MNEVAMAAPLTLPAPIRTYLNDFVVRQRRLEILKATGEAAAAFTGWMLLWCAIDRFAHLPSPVRAGVLIIGAGAAVWMIARAVARWLRRPNWVTAAQDAEEVDTRFGQKLMTVTSQILTRPDLRGSDQILARLAEEVSEQLALKHRRPRGRWGRVMAPWAICILAAVLSIVLWRLPGLRYRQLAIRFFAPMADVPAVTTTQLDVLPGDVDIVQSRPITIEARASQLGDSSLTLYLSDNDRDWSAATMTPIGGGAYTFAVQAVDHDLRYYISGGDARSREYAIRVLRRPAISRFAIRYAYPPYSRMAAANVSNEDGRIEAPAGTRVNLTISATEPLQEATFLIDGQKQSMRPASEPAARQVDFTVVSSATYDIDLVSARNVNGSGPADCVIRALADLPPQVRLLRGGESLSQAPLEIVPLSYEALDDFALASLTLNSQINSEPPAQTVIKLWGDPRRQQDVHPYDLAKIPGLHVGDVVTLTLAATDSGGHEVKSLPLQVLISPKPVDLDAYQRIVELTRAAQLARALAGALVEANRMPEASSGKKDRRSNPSMSLGPRADRALSSASQTAAALRQSLLKVITHGPNMPLAPVAANWIDVVEIESAAAQEAFRQSGAPGGLDDAGRRALAAASDQATHLADSLETVSRSEQAEAIIKDRNNLVAARHAPLSRETSSRQRLDQALERKQQEISAESRQLGLDATAPDFDTRLTQINASGLAIVAADASRAVDYAAAVRAWVEHMRTAPQRRMGMDARLAAAAQAEAVQSDSDLLRARDLDLASRAAWTIAAAIRTAQPGSAAMLKAFADDASITLSGPRQPTQLHSAALSPARHAQLESARADMLKLAGGADVPLPGTRPFQIAGDSQKDIDDIAMQANAASANRQYQRAQDLAGAMGRQLRSRPRRDRWGSTQPTTLAADSDTSPSGDRIERHRLEADRNMANARRVDDLDQRQSQLAGRLASGDTAAALAEQQRSVAEEIDGVRLPREGDASTGYEQTDGRERATTEVLAAIEQLAVMPQALAETQALASTQRNANHGVQTARAAALAAAEDQRGASRRAAEEAIQVAKDAAERVATASRSLNPSVARGLANRLASFAPETDSARDAIEARLIPALEAFEESLAGDDGDFVDRAAADTREAIQATQRELATARDLLVKRDPLAAAKWFARAAAQSLSASPPDVGGARRHQAGVFESLSRAWDQSIHRAAAERLAVVPSLSPVLGPPFPGGRGGRGQGSQQGGQFSNGQDWGRLRDEGAGLDPGLRDSEPPGYEQSLRLYFEALGHAGEAK